MSQLIETGVAYLALKAAQRLYGKAPAALEVAEFERVQSIAQQQHQLETRVLAAPEARDVMVPPATVEAAMQEIRGRYPNEEDFSGDLARNGLEEASFAAALERELKVDAIMEKVGTRAEGVSEMDVDLYYQYHPEQFRRPETRLARHILITINESIAENTRAEAGKRIAVIQARLAKEPQRFEEQALKHSECPTALDGGKLGDLPRGKLFPELDKALFELKAGEVSGVLESELGFHVLRCDAITEANVLGYDQAKQHIRKLLEQKRKRVCQQAWVKGLVDRK
ncbi:nitrogen fixation protein NifM [Sideroxydans lithotrophicus]|uniref:peptidylprolyl isomerase n=1 Tax=Sideroxydans lithotrophicus (strain ES-1) TaxID=580332 RepID=D5CPB0_SIDLE|nr:nitrogen fixation protein NifM [Sideroxydans lithotrophicus]ADE11051.1 nitrogen fixation protein NifM [Sideroxydans lithotrophicus ES-1]